MSAAETAFAILCRMEAQLGDFIAHSQKRDAAFQTHLQALLARVEALETTCDEMKHSADYSHVS